jgi:putative MATE family efflux protein
MSAAMALSVATTAVVARAWGANDKGEASAATTSSISLAFLIATLLALPTFFLAGPFVSIFGLDEVTSKLAVDYVRPVALFNVSLSLVVTLSTSFRAISSVIKPLQFAATSTVIGISLSYIMVRGAFGFEATGIEGIAIGTGIGQIVVVLYFIARWLMGQYDLRFTSSALFEKSRIRKLLDIGAPAAFEQLIIQLSFIVFIVFVGGYGTAAYAAYGIGITILSVCIVVGLGFGAASSTLSGQALGADDKAGARAAGWASMRLSVALMTIIAALIYLARDFLAAQLSTDMETRALTEYFILILALIQPLMAIEFAIGGALRGAGDTRYPLLVTFSGMILGRLSVGYAVYAFEGPIELMYAVIIADYMIKATMLILRFRGDKWVSAGARHAPTAVQSVAGVSRVAVRSYYREHPSDEDIDEEKQK